MGTPQKNTKFSNLIICPKTKINIQVGARIDTVTHTRTDTGVLLGYTYATGVLLGYTHPHWLYTTMTLFALDIYEDSTHIIPGMGHGINTGTHICIVITCPECHQKFNPLNLGGFRLFFLVGLSIYIMFFDESVFFVFAFISPVVMYFLLSCDVFLNHHSPTRYFYVRSHT